ncbi:MAG: nucleotidyltransferase family protein [Candidatus Omnitrophota bacterium]
MKMRKEEEILILCSRPFIIQDNIEKIQELLTGGINWDAFLELSLSTDIFPVIAKNLLTIDDVHIPKELIEKEYKNQQDNYVINSMLLWNSFKEVLDSARRKQISFIPIKGIILNQLVYENPGLRYATDIDIIVKKEELSDLESILKDLGYLLKTPTEKIKSTYLKHRMHFTFNKEHHLGTTIILETHWDILPLFRRIDNVTRDFWANAKESLVFGEKVLTLSAEDLLFESIIEIYKDIIERKHFLIKRHLDIFQILKHYERKIDWKGFIKRVNQYGIKNLVYYSLCSNKELFSNKIISKELLNEIKPSYIKKIFVSKIKINLFKKQIGALEHFYNLFVSEALLLNRLKVFLLQLFYMEFPDIDFCRGKERISYIFACLGELCSRQFKKIYHFFRKA